MSSGEISGTPLRVAIVACEASGDALGAGLIDAIKLRLGNAEFFGVAGDRMVGAGCDPWYRIEEISVMGIAEVLPHLPRLMRLRRKLIRRIVDYKPDVFVGIDSPDFNLPIQSALKQAGISVVQYVSPQVWAWRQSRVSSIRRATDLVLCVLPFEVDFYAEHGVAAEFVGHPLADEIPFDVDSIDARAAIGAEPDKPLIGILPGSRRSEVSKLSDPFLATARWLQERRPELRFAVALASANAGKIFEQAMDRIELNPRPLLVTGNARAVMAAADTLLTASGTATLEALLLERRMVVAYRLSPLTYALIRWLGVAKLENFSLPNLLSGRSVVPEFVQGAVRPAVMGPAVLDMLDEKGINADWRELFRAIHRQMRLNASDRAADAILGISGRGAEGE